MHTIYYWLLQTRRSYENNELPPHRRKLFEESGLKDAVQKEKRLTVDEDRWLEQMKEVVEYRRKYGMDPQKESGRLYEWLARNRPYYKRKVPGEKMSQARRKLMEANDLMTEMRDEKRLAEEEAQWTEKLNAVLEHRREHGFDPTRSTSVSLNNWLIYHRNGYAGKTGSSRGAAMTPKCRKIFEDSGLLEVLPAPKPKQMTPDDTSWLEKMNEVIAYRRENGGKDPNYKTARMYKWLCLQRQHFRENKMQGYRREQFEKHQLHIKTKKVVIVK